MSKKIKLFLIFALSSFFLISHWMDFWTDKISSKLQNGSSSNLVDVWTNIIVYLLWLIYFIAIVYWLYGWFVILTSWWEDAKMKKWKNIIIYVVVWIALMFLASTIVNWTINTMSSDKIISTTSN